MGEVLKPEKVSTKNFKKGSSLLNCLIMFFLGFLGVVVT